ncbi:MAG: hypothetical protein ACRYG7_10855 [Janthinobacterium lividum]
MNRTFWLKKAVKFVFFAALFVVAAVYLTQALWNWLVPSLFHGPVISFAQTLGLLVLSRILFGGFGRGRGSWAQKRRQWRQHLESKVAHLTPEEREKFRQQMQHRCAGAWGRRTAAPEATTSAAQPA